MSDSKVYKIKVDMFVRGKKNDIFSDGKFRFEIAYIELDKNALLTIRNKETCYCMGHKLFYSNACKKYYYYSGNHIGEIMDTETFIKKCDRILKRHHKEDIR